MTLFDTAIKVGQVWDNGKLNLYYSAVFNTTIWRYVFIVYICLGNKELESIGVYVSNNSSFIELSDNRHKLFCH